MRNIDQVPGLKTGLVVLLLAILAGQLLAGMARMSVTSDETSHLPAGYTYLKTGDMRLNPQHPPLIKLLAAVPLLPLHPKLNLRDPNWLSDPPNEWEFGEEFLHSNDVDRLLFAGRFPIVLLSILLGFFVFRWASQLFGTAAGLLALFLYVLSPNILAHSRIVTMDLGLSCFSLLFLYNLWRWSRERKRSSLVWSSLCLGLALATKFSAVILLPVAATLALATVDWKKRELDRVVGGLVAITILAGLVVWALYRFPADLSFYLDGMALVNADHDPNRAYYLMGEFRVGGFPHYFLMAFLFKTPLPTLLLLAGAIILMRRYGADRKTDELFLILPAATFFIVTTALADGIGLRYLLPVYPLLFIFISRLAPMLSAGHVPRIIGAGLLLWYAGSAAWIFPHHLAYFNEAAGGPANGYKLLNDSNLDWGQDLPLLKQWQDETGSGPLRLLYAWNGRPENYGIEHVRVTPKDWYEKPAPGTYVVSTFWLVRGLHEHRTRDVPTNWLEMYEPVDRIGYSFFVYRF